MSGNCLRVAVIGAGMAGATCARALADAGHAVEVFDKSRGAGGRMSARRVPWGAGEELRLDHGAPGFGAEGPDFLAFLEQARQAGLLARWTPRLASGCGAEPGGAMWVPTPDMPALCRWLLSGLPLRTLATVDRVRRSRAGWSLESAGATLADGFDAVAVAIPPQQAAALLLPHRADWARRAQGTAMLPAWVLMGVTELPAAPCAWDVLQPVSGPLSLVLRNDARPGRTLLPGLAQWVVHAVASWSRAHLETPPAEVQAALQAALADCVGAELAWRHAAVHRWLYAAPALAPALNRRPAGGECAWWDVRTGLGVCGDTLGGGGVEGAWRSGTALAGMLAGGMA
ncbi:NAD(P)/FAD-dependent oxidoreductase [Massilia sp. X63]|uniref:NAD(P)/FAD-dependent oxidoreductase n=1 Tax=Massilia sp. X63 TaxID=3237285 RepID=UPI0034DD3061